MDRRSPIERMIDEATGFKGGPAPRTVILSCDMCPKTKTVPVNKTDPPNCAMVCARCPDCSKSGERDDVSYFDAQGRQLDPDGNLLP